MHMLEDVELIGGSLSVGLLSEMLLECHAQIDELIERAEIIQNIIDCGGVIHER
jgi:hypothetical protein